MRLIFVSIVAALLIGCTAKEPDAPSTTDQAPDTTQELTDTHRINAIFASFGQDLTQICIDPKQGVLLNFSSVKSDERTADQQAGNSEMVGWQLTDKFRFYPLSNGTWFTTDIPSDSFVRVYPIVSGLSCFTRQM